MYGNHLYKQSILGSRKVVLHCAPFFSIIVPSLLTACKTGLKETYHFLPHLLRKQKQFEFHGSLREVTAGTQFCPGRLWMSNGETNVFFPVSSLLASGLSSFSFPRILSPQISWTTSKSPSVHPRREREFTLQIFSLKVSDRVWGRVLAARFQARTPSLLLPTASSWSSPCPHLPQPHHPGQPKGCLVMMGESGSPIISITAPKASPISIQSKLM